MHFLQDLKTRKKLQEPANSKSKKIHKQTNEGGGKKKKKLKL
jgi:hypothetical protein